MQTKQLEELIESGDLLISVGHTQQQHHNLVHQAPAIPDFQSAWKNFINAYSSLSPDSKRQKLQHIAATHDSSSFTDLLETCWQQGLSQIVQSQPSSQVRMEDNHEPRICECIDCPFKKQLGRIENFYEDIFSLKG